MEGRKPVGSSSYSISSDLFGDKDSSPSKQEPTTSTKIFGDVFPPAATVLARDLSRSEVLGSWKNQNTEHQGWGTKPASTDSISQSMPNKNRRSIFQDETVEPCFLSSSIYYGGRDICSNIPNTRASGTPQIFKKDGGEDDMNGGNSSGASRGNWWQGSLYY
eukprot:TRINITY_DN2941_c2_g2_i1.p1 TRINITY_DN2941_c2_g2~~TRINITY_DN2941_c2_g2_i1.p1  ORF type:complete len:162 (+),score=22.51 TRINITY_DN2941_c2_g2_i1:295-780(+)